MYRLYVISLCISLFNVGEPVTSLLYVSRHYVISLCIYLFNAGESVTSLLYVSIYYVIGLCIYLFNAGEPVTSLLYVSIHNAHWQLDPLYSFSHQETKDRLRLTRSLISTEITKSKLYIKIPLK